MDTELKTLPLWKHALTAMRSNGLTFGKVYQSDFFEKHFKAELGTTEFAFAMIELRRELEREDKYYLTSSENGKLWTVTPAAEILDVNAIWKRRIRRTMLRQVNLLSGTLDNPKAELTNDERKQMASENEKAAIRFVLFNRSKTAWISMKKKEKLLPNATAQNVSEHNASDHI